MTAARPAAQSPGARSRRTEVGAESRQDEKRSDPPATREVEATIAIAGYNCEDYLQQAVTSALCQDLAIEVIIVDDASTDGTVDLAHRLAREDGRIRVIQMRVNVGPAGARNAALECARGRWFCILDADDLMHPDRLKTLIACAEAEDADLIADDLIVFDEANVKDPERFLTRQAPGSSHWLTLAKYLGSTRMSTRQPNLGYLKPVIRLARLKQAGIKYAEKLRIGEDDHFVLSMLLAGFRYRVMVLPYYYYRKHSSSISHRLSRETIEQIATVAQEMEPSLKLRAPEEQRAFAARIRSVKHTAAFVRFLDHVRARQWRDALQALVRNPGAIPLLRQPPLDRLRRWATRRTCLPTADHQVLVIARSSQQQIASRAASKIRELGYSPTYLFIDDQPTTPLIVAGRRLDTAITHIPAAYFQRHSAGNIVANARLAILRLARKAELAVLVGPVPRPLAKEFFHLTIPLFTFDLNAKHIALAPLASRMCPGLPEVGMAPDHE